MLTHSRPHVRKRAVLALNAVASQYPEARVAAMPRIRDRLEDTDQSVVAATVNMLCELARQ
jgi:AP-3 complex subunit delta-1